jgi:uncharacterized membrane protein YkoI
MVWTVPEMAIDREHAISKLTGAGLMGRFPIGKSVHCGQAREQMIIAAVLDERARRAAAAAAANQRAAKRLCRERASDDDDADAAQQRKSRTKKHVSHGNWNCNWNWDERVRKRSKAVHNKNAGNGARRSSVEIRRMSSQSRTEFYTSKFSRLGQG